MAPSEPPILPTKGDSFGVGRINANDSINRKPRWGLDTTLTKLR